jgi:hypothetical protein
LSINEIFSLPAHYIFLSAIYISMLDTDPDTYGYISRYSGYIGYNFRSLTFTIPQFAHFTWILYKNTAIYKDSCEGGKDAVSPSSSAPRSPPLAVHPPSLYHLRAKHSLQHRNDTQIHYSMLPLLFYINSFARFFLLFYTRLSPVFTKQLTYNH